MTDIPRCDLTGQDVDECDCVLWFDYDERDADDEREQIDLDERD